MKRSEVFEAREPPPHGWARLRARLDERSPRRWPWLVVATVAALLLAVVLWPKRAPQVDFAAQLVRATAAPELGLGEPGPTLAVSEGAAERLPSTDPSVLLYRVQMVEPD
jgi:hypothetical protein